MNLRTTTGIRVAQATANMQAQASATAEWQKQISSTKRLERPSQGPSDFVALIDYKARDLRLQSFVGAIDDSSNDLNEGVSHLVDAKDILTKAQSLALDGANAPSDASSTEAIATEVDSLISRLVSVGNTKVGNRYLFSGSATTTQPFAVTAFDAQGRPTTISYQGSDERARGIVGQGQTVDTMYSGNRVFQAPGGDVFQSLISLRDNLRDPSLTQSQRSLAINQNIAQIESSRTSILNTVGEQSSALENLSAVKSRFQDVRINVQSRVSDLESTDFAEAAVKFQEQQNAFQATLAVTAKLFDGGLLQFIQ